MVGGDSSLIFSSYIICNISRLSLLYGLKYFSIGTPVEAKQKVNTVKTIQREIIK